MTMGSELLLVAGVILAAALVGALIPALLQLRRTLKKAEETLDSTGTRLDRVLDELAVTTSRINQLGPEFRDRKERIKELLDEIADLSRPLRQARASLGKTAMVIGALGPAIAAAVKAFLTTQEARREQATPRGGQPRTKRGEPSEKPSFSETIRNAD
jgi:uncharacterized protein YoxC